MLAKNNIIKKYALFLIVTLIVFTFLCYSAIAEKVQSNALEGTKLQNYMWSTENALEFFVPDKWKVIGIQNRINLDLHYYNVLRTEYDKMGIFGVPRGKEKVVGQIILKSFKKGSYYPDATLNLMDEDYKACHWDEKFKTMGVKEDPIELNDNEYFRIYKNQAYDVKDEISDHEHTHAEVFRCW